jgi:hypothetical protein
MPTRILSLVFLALLLILPVVSEPQTTPLATTDHATLACRALEVHADGELKVIVVVFHQREEAQRSQLAALLRGHSGEIVEVQAGDDVWRRARMVRLKSCFGRGLLILLAPAPFSERTEFALRLPPQ